MICSGLMDIALEIYSIALILDAIRAIANPKIPIKANENRKLDNSAM